MKKRHEQAQGGKQGDCDAFSGPVGHVLAEGSLVPVGPPCLPACSAVCRVSAGQEGRYLVVPPGKPRWSPQGHRHTTDASLERIRTDLSPKGLSPSSSSRALSATKHIGKHRCKMQKGPVPLHTGTAALRASTSPAPTSPRWERPASVWQISELGHAIGAGTPTDVRWQISRRGGAIKIQFGLPVFHLLSF